MSSRELILARVRTALRDVPATEQPQHVPVQRDYLEAHVQVTSDELRQLLADHLADYRAVVHRCSGGELPALLARLFTERGTRSLAVPPGLAEDWLGAIDDLEVLTDHGDLTANRLDRVDSVLTGCTVAIAETGTIILDAGPDQGRRVLTLVPDHHVCVVRAGQVVASVAQALRRLTPTRPLTWVSGPSATSDIELNRVEGVHGPRTLEVVLATD